MGFVSAAMWVAFHTPMPPAAAHGVPADAADTEPAIGPGHWHDDAVQVDALLVDAPRDGARHAALDEGERALAEGRAAAARAAFERAASMQHAADAELGLVRAAMQAGDYRGALAMAAHVAGAHVDEPAAAVLYAWLLRAGGQAVIADDVLAQARARAPLDRTVEAARDAFLVALPRPRDALLEGPQRVAPHAWSADRGVAIPPTARVVATAVLVERGRTAILPALPGVAAGERLWLRNGLGQTVAATVEAVEQAAPASRGLLRLRLAAALPMDDGDEAAADRPPNAGSAAVVVEYASGGAARAAWPWLRQGFLGPLGQSGERRLGIAADAGLRGGAVLDARGRLVGIAVPGSRGAAAWLPASAWAAAGGDELPRAATAASAPGVPASPLDRTYERGLRLALQVIAVAAEP